MSKRIRTTNPSYDAIHTEWVANGRPSQFDIFFQEGLIGGQDGGAIFRVLDTDADEPDFYMAYSGPPTTFDTDSAIERPEQRGFMLFNEDYWRWKMECDHEGSISVEMEDAPNLLE